MRKPASMKALEKLGRVRLSEHFFMREKSRNSNLLLYNNYNSTQERAKNRLLQFSLTYLGDSAPTQGPYQRPLRRPRHHSLSSREEP